uniref:ATPase AAA-type core domain-containing protein n=1 Tax=Panagrolaimus davidi TaxID=227884 RepID=A0A914QF00_9BILA
MSSTKDKLLKAIDDTLIGLDAQFLDLYNVFETFVSTKTGKSCLIVGQELSGKTTLIEAVYKKFPRDFVEQNIVNIDGHFCDDSEGTNLMGNQTKESKLVIVDNFEQFAVRSRQQLLYTIMNQACSSNCLVLFCSRDANCTDAFEKRVRSRFSQKKIFLDPDEETPIERLSQLLIPSTWKCKDKESLIQWTKFCNGICSKNKFIEREMERVVSCGLGTGIYKLKQIALLLAAKYFDNIPEEYDTAVTGITVMVTLRSSTEILDYLTTLEIQEVFILEIMRRLTERNGLREIQYLNIFQSL